MADRPVKDAPKMPEPSSRKPPRRPPGHGPKGFMRPEDKAKDFKGAMRNIWSLIAAFKVQVILVVVFAIGSTVFSIIGPKVLSEATTVLFNGVVAQISGDGSIDFSLIGKILVATLCIYLFSALCSWVQSWVMSYVSQKTCYDLRRRISEKIEHLPFGYFNESSTGDVLSRITNDVDTLGQSLNQGVTQMIVSVTTVIGVIVMMFYINWIMTLIALLMIPLSLILVFVIVKHSQKYFFAQQNLLGDVNGIVEETFSGHEIVKAFSKEDETVRDFDATNDMLYASAWKSQFLSGLMQPIMAFIGNLGYVAVAISGSFFAVMGAITVGDIQAFIQYVRNLSQPLTQLAQVSNVLQQLAAASERIFDFLNEKEIEGEPDEAMPKDARMDVAFENVSFSYIEGEPVIKDFSVKVDEGQSVAIVGPTGAGKTTLVKLLMRFYDVDKGSISIGGVNIESVNRRSVRSLFAMVLQDTWLFNGTIRENIRFGRLDATDEEVEQACKDAFAHHFIMTLPGGYDFQIDEDASNISAGQKQLLTIARAILADRKMLILDEATSSVDTMTEQRIQSAMDNLMAEKTSFVIAHRLSTIRIADVILVIDDGDIVEQGTHEQLMSIGGFYSELYNSQFQNR